MHKPAKKPLKLDPCHLPEEIAEKVVKRASSGPFPSRNLLSLHELSSGYALCAKRAPFPGAQYGPPWTDQLTILVHCGPKCPLRTKPFVRARKAADAHRPSENGQNGAVRLEPIAPTNLACRPTPPVRGAVVGHGSSRPSRLFARFALLTLRRRKCVQCCEIKVERLLCLPARRRCG